MALGRRLVDGHKRWGDLGEYEPLISALDDARSFLSASQAAGRAAPAGGGEVTP